MAEAAGALSVADSIRQTLHAAMTADPSVLVLGESVGALGGVFRTTTGLQAEFGEQRVVQTPLSESATLGLALGLAMGGKRPVVEVVTGAAAAFSQLGELATLHGAEFPLPVVLRVPLGALPGGGHTVDMVGTLVGMPGIQVLAPSHPADAAAMLQQALDSQRPTVLIESIPCYAERASKPAGAPGKAVVHRSGRDLTLLSFGAAVSTCEDIAASSEHDLGVVDLRSLSPLDTETLAAELRRSGRAILVHPSLVDDTLSRNLLAQVTQAAFLYLESPPTAVTADPAALSQAISASLRF
ncbi:MAG: transketolase C-terminal domain-containing protein [Myxococcota bacterium]|nr:transketolase C-terminal domain-containing protein [Myxococcota bacterium]